MSEIAVTREGSGWMGRCDCGWESYAATRTSADLSAHKHRTNHPAPKRTKDTTPKPARTVSWDDREDSTWIDKL